jgi:hypothetical protein
MRTGLLVWQRFVKVSNDADVNNKAVVVAATEQGKQRGHPLKLWL